MIALRGVTRAFAGRAAVAAVSLTVAAGTTHVLLGSSGSTAVLIARQATVARVPRTWAALQRGMVGKIDQRTMAPLNAIADVDGRTFAEAAAALG